MARRVTKTGGDSIINQMQPTVAVVVLALSGVAWAYNTFAQITTVRDEVSNIKSIIETRHQTAIQHSDQNKEIMLSALGEIKDSLRIIQDKLINRGIEHR